MPRPSLEIGSTLASYTIEAVLGQGMGGALHMAMGVVYGIDPADPQALDAISKALSHACIKGSDMRA